MSEYELDTYECSSGEHRDCCGGCSCFCSGLRNSCPIDTRAEDLRQVARKTRENPIENRMES